MPFVARCFRCGHVVSARTRAIIDLCCEEHDLASHGSHDSDLWTVAIISDADYYMMERLSKVKTFWAVQRLPRKVLLKLAH